MPSPLGTIPGFGHGVGRRHRAPTAPTAGDCLPGPLPSRGPRRDSTDVPAAHSLRRGSHGPGDSKSVMVMRGYDDATRWTPASGRLRLESRPLRNPALAESRTLLHWHKDGRRGRSSVRKSGRAAQTSVSGEPAHPSPYVTPVGHREKECHDKRDDETSETQWSLHGPACPRPGRRCDGAGFEQGSPSPTRPTAGCGLGPGGSAAPGTHVSSRSTRAPTPIQSLYAGRREPSAQRAPTMPIRS